MKKKFANKIHFKRRFKERVGYEISDTQYEDLKRLVKSEGRFLRMSNDLNNPNGSIYSVKYENIEMVVVYDAFKDTLITILSK